MDKYKEEILLMLKNGRISNEDAQKLLNSHTEYPLFSKSIKNLGYFLGLAVNDIIEKFHYLITLELPEERNRIKKQSIWQEELNEEVFKADISNVSSINLYSYNGNLSINTTPSNNFLITVSYRKKNLNGTFNLSNQNGNISLNYSENLFKNVHINALIPKTIFNKLSIGAINGNIFVQNILSQMIYCNSKNGEIFLEDINFNGINIDSLNVQSHLLNIKGENLNIKSSNGNTIIKNFDIENINISNISSNITLNDPVTNNYIKYKWCIKTKRGNLSINKISMLNLGIYLKAIGVPKINLKIPILRSYPNYVEKKSNFFDIRDKQLIINAKTTKGIVKIT